MSFVMLLQHNFFSFFFIISGKMLTNRHKRIIVWCLSWLQDKQLQSSRGIIIANQTLVLQGISKATHGQYMCRATNPQGTVGSNEVYLDVKCKLFKWNIFYLTDCFAENFSFMCVILLWKGEKLSYILSGWVGA